jgi:hypothetical protein
VGSLQGVNVFTIPGTQNILVQEKSFAPLTTLRVRVSAFPLAMIPVFLVPLSVLLHLASWQKLHGTRDLKPLLTDGERGVKVESAKSGAGERVYRTAR